MQVVQVASPWVQAEVAVESAEVAVEWAEVAVEWAEVAVEWAEVAVEWAEVAVQQVVDNAGSHFLRHLQEDSSLHRVSFYRQRLRARRAPGTTRHAQTIKVVKAR